MTQRQDAVTSLNKVNYILLHADQFASFNPGEYTGYAHQLSEAINTLTKAASDCVNAPKDARFPQNIAIPPITHWPERKDGEPVQPVQVPFHRPHPQLTAEQMAWAVQDQTPLSGFER